MEAVSGLQRTPYQRGTVFMNSFTATLLPISFGRPLRLAVLSWGLQSKAHACIIREWVADFLSRPLSHRKGSVYRQTWVLGQFYRFCPKKGQKTWKKAFRGGGGKKGQKRPKKGFLGGGSKNACQNRSFFWGLKAGKGFLALYRHVWSKMAFFSLPRGIFPYGQGHFWHFFPKNPVPL